MGYATDLAENVYTVLSAAALTGTPTVTLAYMPEFPDEGQASGSIQVFVFLANREWTIENRCATITKNYTINIGIREYVARGSDGKLPNAGITTLLDLSEQIVDTMLTNRTLTNGTLSSVTEQQPFDFQRMFENGVFENLISLEYRAK